MKKTLLAAAALIAALASCQKEMEAPEMDLNENRLERSDRFMVSLEGTKTTIDDSLQVRWAEGDSIRVNGVIYELAEFYEDSTRAEFKKRRSEDITPKAPFNACFPADWYDESTMMLAVPDTIYRKDSEDFSMPMFAQSNTRTMAFTNVGGVLAISVSKKEAASVKVIKVEDESETIKTVICNEAVTPDSTGTTFYVSVEPGSYQSLTVGIYANEGDEESVTEMFSRAANGIEIQANTLYAISYKTSLKGITLSKQLDTLKIGVKDTLTITCDPINATNQEAEWESTDSTVASVDAAGRIEALKAGETLIIATSKEGSYKDTCILTVINPIKVTLSSENQQLLAGKKNTITADVTENGIPSSKEASWSTTNSSIATVSGGEITAVAAGTANIIATVEGNSDTCEVRVVPTDIFQITALEDGVNVYLETGKTAPKVSIQYSTDGINWTDTTKMGNGKTKDTTTLCTGLEKDSKLYIWAGDNGNTRFGAAQQSNSIKLTGGKVNLSGNIMYLLNNTPSTSIDYGNTFKYLFNNDSTIVSASELKLSATSLADSCYYSMFRNCSGLKSAPELPAKSLAKQCYRDMFGNCSALESAPELPAETLSDYCYYWMFKGCSNLSVVTMKATDVSADNCLNMWFNSAGTGEKTLYVNEGISEETKNTIAENSSGWAVTKENCYPGTYDQKGIKIGDVTWAPVNCGYDSTDYKVGKLYQWGRMDGSGYYNNTDVTTPAQDASDKKIQTNVEVATWPDGGYTLSPAYDTFYKTTAQSSEHMDWYTDTETPMNKWPMAASEAPSGSSRIGNPCPSGWRVPTADEFGNLLFSDWVSSTQTGETKRSTYSYSSGYGHINGLVLPLAGYLSNGGSAQDRGNQGRFWLSSASLEDSTKGLMVSLYNTGVVTLKTGLRVYAYSVRCVQDSTTSGK